MRVCVGQSEEVAVRQQDFNRRGVAAGPRRHRLQDGLPRQLRLQEGQNLFQQAQAFLRRRRNDARAEEIVELQQPVEVFAEEGLELVARLRHDFIEQFREILSRVNGVLIGKWRLRNLAEQCGLRGGAQHAGVRHLLALARLVVRDAHALDAIRGGVETFVRRHGRFHRAVDRFIQPERHEHLDHIGRKHQRHLPPQGFIAHVIRIGRRGVVARNRAQFRRQRSDPRQSGFAVFPVFAERIETMPK